MNHAPEAPRARTVVRPRDAASLIVLRGAGRGLEVLAGRRPRHAKFMPGVWVFPGGAIDPEDRNPWPVESGADTLPPRLARCARAALRETWEETGVLVGRLAAVQFGGSEPGRPAPVERAYRERGLAASFDALIYVGRAITPTRAFRRFNTRFFLADGAAVFGEPMASDELEDVGWHPVGDRPLAPAADVTHFMLARAIALREGSARAEPPLFYTVRTKRRITVCRESAPVL